MAESTDWIEGTYKNAFDEETRGLQRRRASDKTLKIEELEGMLESLYIYQGNNKTGRSLVADTALAGTIAAFEEFIAEWKKEQQQ